VVGSVKVDNFKGECILAVMHLVSVREREDDGA
jgi:hypothetical protein